MLIYFLINIFVEHPKPEVVFDIVMVCNGQSIIMWSISEIVLSRFQGR